MDDEQTETYLFKLHQTSEELCFFPVIFHERPMDDDGLKDS
jgi:hypothetical protein